jgi:hypothetical protein
MMEEGRFFYKQTNKELKKTDLSDLREGDIFRIVDLPIEEGYQDGTVLFKAISDPYKNENGIGTIDVQQVLEFKDEG